MRNIIILSIVICLTGCMSYNVQTFGEFDPEQKTITVHAGGKSLNGKIKNMLRTEGWQLIVDRGPRITEGEFGEKTKLQEYDSFNSRYRLALAYRRMDISLRLQVIYSYDISLIDNKTGTEVITLSGKGEEDVIVDKLKAAIKDNTR